MTKEREHINKRKRTPALAILLSAVLLLSACGTGAPAGPAPEKEQPAGVQEQTAAQEELTAVETQEQSSAAETQEQSSAAEVQEQSSAAEVREQSSAAETQQPAAPDLEETDVIKNDPYGAALTDQAFKSTKENTIMSPLSINMALAMALEGAEGKTKEEIENYLGVTKDGLDDYITGLLTNIASMGDATVIISNAFWYLTGTDVNGEFLKTLRERYAAETGELDFTDAQAAEIINGWCNEHTKGLIPEIISPGDIASLSDLILNTVYFKCAWVKPVEIIRTETFHGSDQETDADFLYTDEKAYFENDKATAFSKSYRDRFSFIGILPKEEGDFNLADLDLESLLASRTYDYDVHAVMPKLEVDSGGSITQILKDMGIRTAFTQDADFSGISDDLHISDVIHKTKLILDENGTEAAAATAIALAAGAFMGEVKEKTVRLDRPFAFMIIDDETETVLFVGKIVEV